MNSSLWSSPESLHNHSDHGASTTPASTSTSSSSSSSSSHRKFLVLGSLMVALSDSVLLCSCALLLAVLRRHPPLRHKLRHVLLGNLLVGDSAFSLITTATYVLIHVEVPLPRVSCLLYVMGQHIALGGGLVTIGAMSLDRYAAICLPLRHRTAATPERFPAILAAIWALAAAFPLVSLAADSSLAGSLPLEALHGFICCMVEEEAGTAHRAGGGAPPPPPPPPPPLPFQLAPFAALCVLCVAVLAFSYAAVYLEGRRSGGAAGASAGGGAAARTTIALHSLHLLFYCGGATGHLLLRHVARAWDTETRCTVRLCSVATFGLAANMLPMTHVLRCVDLRGRVRQLVCCDRHERRWWRRRRSAPGHGAAAAAAAAVDAGEGREMLGSRREPEAREADGPLAVALVATVATT